MPQLSAIMITKDEERNIAACLDSVAFCDERIVVDCGSQDDTVRLATERGARVIVHPWTDHGRQKNIALSHATGDWVFLIDADERVSPASAAELGRAMREARAAGFEMPRLSSFCGRQMRHSGWYPDYVLRLFRRGQGRFSDDPVHTRVICDGPVARLTEPLIHHPVLKIEEAISRVDRYSTAGALQIVQSGRRVGFTTGIWHGLFSFFRTFVLRGGFLDGPEGFLLAVANAEGAYYKYMKAWLQTRGERSF